MIKCIRCQQNITYDDENSYHRYDAVFISDCERFVIVPTEDGKRLNLPICESCYNASE